MCWQEGAKLYMRDDDKDENKGDQAGDSGSSVYAMVQAVLNFSGRAQKLYKRA